MINIRTARARKKGFTLIELMVCVAIFALIAMAVQAVFNAVMKMWMKGDARLEMYQNGRLVLERMGVGMRSAIRPDLRDHNHDGVINASDTDVGGARFLGVNYADQASAVDGYVDAATDGCDEGYKQSDAVAFLQLAYGNWDQNSDMVGYTYGISNRLGNYYDGSVNRPYHYELKLGTSDANALDEYSNTTYTYSTANHMTVNPNVGNMRPYVIGGSYGMDYAMSPEISDMELEYFAKNVLATSTASGATFYDSSKNSGRLPVMVRILITCDTTNRAVPLPIHFGTFVNITTVTGVDPATGYY